MLVPTSAVRRWFPTGRVTVDRTRELVGDGTVLRVQRIHGVVQHYDWGDPDFIPTLLGEAPDGRPWAELWLGTHPHGPATLDDGRPLLEASGELPYLLKVLAARRPLSLQTHPDRRRAEEGHAAGRYPDPRPKPELLCALTRFEALCGVRPVDDTLDLLDELGVGDLRSVLASEGPGPALEALYRGRLEPGPVVEACVPSTLAEARWVRRLAERYPDDPSVAATLLLNLVELAPGQAIHLAAGNLHAYLGGCGLELMGASDNVVRGGLTTKDVDVDELLRVVDPTPLDRPLLDEGRCYALDEVGVRLCRLDAGERHTARGHELMITDDGVAWYLAPGDTTVAARPAHVVTTGSATASADELNS